MEADLSSLDLTTLSQRLSEALDALHQLQTGASAIDVRFGDRGDRVVRYQETDIARLENYIQQLLKGLDFSGHTGKRELTTEECVL